MEDLPKSTFSFKNLFIPITKTKACIIIIFVGFIVFSNSFFNGFVMDDENQIINAHMVHSITNFTSFFTGGTFGGNGSMQLTGAYYRPFPTVILSLVYTLFGPNPLFFHATQVLLHIGNSLLIFFFLRFFLRKSNTSLFLALIFLIHPINAEAVNYISAIQTTACLFFGLLALFLFLKKPAKISTFFVFFLLFLSLLSKETGAVFILLLIFLQWLQKRMNEWKLYVYGSSMVLLYAFLRLFVAHMYIHGANNTLIPIVNMPLVMKIVNIPAIIFYYIHAFLFPNNIAVDQNWIVHSLTWQEFFFPLFCCLSIGIVIMTAISYLYKKNKHDCTLFLFFTCWFVSFMLLVLPFFPLDFTVADRWFYFPIVGLLGMIGVVIPWIKFNSALLYKSVRVLMIVIIGVLALCTFIRNNIWNNGFTLYTHDVLISQNSFDLENNLGVMFLREGDIKNAEIHINKSLALASENADALLNRGLIYEKNSNIFQAKKYYLLAAQKGLSTGLENYVGSLLFYDNNASISAKLLEKNIGKYPRNQRLWMLLAVYNQIINKAQIELR
jgi:tetratricopeptide (TPR) repeat protein